MVLPPANIQHPMRRAMFGEDMYAAGELSSRGRTAYLLSMGRREYIAEMSETAVDLKAGANQPEGSLPVALKYYSMPALTCQMFFCQKAVRTCAGDGNSCAVSRITVPCIHVCRVML